MDILCHKLAMLMRSFRYKLAPTPEQENLFRQFSSVCRLIYNLAWEQRRDFWRQYHRQMGRHIGYFAQARELTILRSQYDWIAAVSQPCQQQALRDLDKAFSNFFKGAASYPTPRHKNINESFRFQRQQVGVKKINTRYCVVRLPKIGWVKFRNTRPLRGTIKNATVIWDASGWHISFACEIEHVAPSNISPSVGIDRGIANTLSLSNGEHLSVPRSLEALERRQRAAQRSASRKKRGSVRHAKAVRRTAKLSTKRARIRRDWHHKVSLNIAQRFGTVVLENLKIQSMSASAKGTLADPGRKVRQKSGLNRSILNQGWSFFDKFVAYKLEERGGFLCKVNPAFTSQTCSACGTIDKQSRESQASFSCQHCGFRINADHNAAINILRRNTASTRMEEDRQVSDEVRTGSRHEPAKNHATEAA